MSGAELRGGNKPSLSEALGWIGFRVDDVYGAHVGRLDDVWIDPGTGAPRWLLVKQADFGGRTTLIPFEDATAGAGQVWVPYEGGVVRGAPEVAPGAPLTQQIEEALRRHYRGKVEGEGAPQAPAPEPAHPRDRSHEAARPEHSSQAPTGAGSAAPGAPEAQEQGFAQERGFERRYSPPPPDPDRHVPPPPPPAAAAPGQGAAEQPEHAYQPPPEPGWQRGDDASDRPVALPLTHGLDRPYRVEIHLEGDLRISGELKGFRVIPTEPSD